MAIRMQYCPVCQKQTPHTYKPVSWFWFIVWLVLFFPVAIIYLIVAMPRANRTAQCTVDHEAIRRAQRVDDMAQLVAAMREANTPEVPRKRGTGFMSRDS